MRPVLASPDSQATVMLCTRLALPKGADGLKPLSLVEWNHLAVRIARSEWQRPGALLGRAAGELRSVLGLGLPQAERMARLLERGGQLALEVERLADRGIWILTRADEDYPARWRQRLRGQAPAVCFGAGERALLGHGGLAVVGSRNVDEAGETFARFVGERCASCGLPVVSGSARGVDRAAMTGALAAGGRAVGVVASSLEAMLGHRETRSWLLKGTLTLVAPNFPANPFTVGGAMARNKLIYCLADSAMVVACDADKGGTRAGALENLRHGWVPLFVRADPEAPAGNRMLLESGAMPVTLGDLGSCPDLRTLLGQRAASHSAPPPPEARLAGAGEPEPPAYPRPRSHRALPPYHSQLPASRSRLPSQTSQSTSFSWHGRSSSRGCTPQGRAGAGPAHRAAARPAASLAAPGTGRGPRSAHRSKVRLSFRSCAWYPFSWRALSSCPALCRPPVSHPAAAFVRPL